MNTITLLPCPFCGGRARITYTDEEGNTKDASYAAGPWSGLRYAIEHNIEHDAEGQCPIASYADDFDGMGTYLYETAQEAAEAWNHRAAKGRDNAEPRFERLLNQLACVGVDAHCAWPALRDTSRPRVKPIRVGGESYVVCGWSWSSVTAGLTSIEVARVVNNPGPPGVLPVDYDAWRAGDGRLAVRVEVHIESGAIMYLERPVVIGQPPRAQ